MPYKRVGKTIYVKRGGKWHVKSHADSVDNARKQLNLLRAVKNGWTPTGK